MELCYISIYYINISIRNTRNADVWNNKGRSLAELRKYEEAISSYDKALEIEPKNADAWNNKGRSLAELDRIHRISQQYWSVCGYCMLCI